MIEDDKQGWQKSSEVGFTKEERVLDPIKGRRLDW